MQEGSHQVHGHVTMNPQMAGSGAIESQAVVKKMPSKRAMPMLVVVVVFAIILGVGTGFVFSNLGSTSSSSSNDTAKVQPQVEGAVSEEYIGETAQGVLKPGGINGEGTHKLERGMGADKDVALNSTVLDLSSFEGKKVQVWGKSAASPNVGWLMDVGKVKVLK